MRLLSTPLLSLLSLVALPTSTQAQLQKPTPPPLLTLSLPPTQALPNPQSLPARTFATLTSANHTQTALFTRRSTFEFADVPAGSYLAEVYVATGSWAFVPMRVDVAQIGKAGGSAEGTARGRKSIKIWQTFRGNEWDNKGEFLGGGEWDPTLRPDDQAEKGSLGGASVDVGVLGPRDFYEKRGGFSPLSLLKNPMILIGVVAMAVMFGMPKIMENMDPEMRAEFEKQQRSSTIANTLTGSGGGGFDAAAWLAGSGQGSDSKLSPRTGSGGGGSDRSRGASPAPGGKTSGSEAKGGGRKRRG